MKVRSIDYKQYLISTQINYTCDYFPQYKEEISGDGVERFLKNSHSKPSFIWEQIKDDIIYSDNGCLIIDKTVLEHKNTTKIQGAYKQWSGSSHDIVMGIGLVNIVYHNPELKRFWTVDCKVWDKDADGKKETTIAKELLIRASDRGIRFSTVLFDGFYATTEIMCYIGLDLGKTFYCNLTSNRNCREKESDQYKQIKDLIWSDQELNNGKIVRLKEVPKRMPVRLFSIATSERRIDTLCTNNTTDMTAKEIQDAYSLRWKVEEFHREIKQTLGISKCQCRKRRSQRNHIINSILGYICLKKLAIKNNITIYMTKKMQLDGYMKNILKHPYWQYEGV
jgi:Transposase DDE domain